MTKTNLKGKRKHPIPIVKFLTQGSQSRERLDIIFSFTRITSDEFKKWAYLHYVDGLSEDHVCMDAGNWSRNCKKLEVVAQKMERCKELDWVKFGYKSGING